MGKSLGIFIYSYHFSTFHDIIIPVQVTITYKYFKMSVSNILSCLPLQGTYTFSINYLIIIPIYLCGITKLIGTNNALYSSHTNMVLQFIFFKIQYFNILKTVVQNFFLSNLHVYVPCIPWCEILFQLRYFIYLYIFICITVKCNYNINNSTAITF